MTSNTAILEKQQSILNKLNVLYGEAGSEMYNKIEALVEKAAGAGQIGKPWVSEKDVMLITYGDSIREEGVPPLQTLHDFLRNYAKEAFSAVHILPFYPYTSDDGFSIVDYRKIDPALGDWSHVNNLSKDFDLMFDAVINHASKSSEWFQRYLNGDPEYADDFIEADPKGDYSTVTRPRDLPLLTAFDTASGTKYVWTTFSEDQVDLNYQSPHVLLEVLDLLIMYAAEGARFLRLDAIGFLWKRIGTICMHLEETHLLIKLIREVLDLCVPGTILISETNVPHEDNISYFGNGYDEAHMVYQFPLPPLTLYSFHVGNARKLAEWAASLDPTTEKTSFFNFLASHDGIGMRPTEGVLTPEERQMMVDKALEHGGRVSYKDNGDGSKSPYELNINYLDALTHPEEKNELRVKKTLAAHTLLLSLAGVPGIYIHSLLGSRNDRKAVGDSGINRRINREKLNLSQLVAELGGDSFRSHVYTGLIERIALRKMQKAFSPQALQQVKFLDDRAFSVLRTHEESGEQVLVLINVSSDKVQLNTGFAGRELIGKELVGKTVELKPYQTMWIEGIK